MISEGRGHVADRTPSVDVLVPVIERRLEGRREGATSAATRARLVDAVSVDRDGNPHGRELIDERSLGRGNADAAVRCGVGRHVLVLVERYAAVEVTRPRQPHLVRVRPRVPFLAEARERTGIRLVPWRAARRVHARGRRRSRRAAASRPCCGRLRCAGRARRGRRRRLRRLERRECLRADRAVPVEPFPRLERQHGLRGAVVPVAGVPPRREIVQLDAAAARLPGSQARRGRSLCGLASAGRPGG